MTTTQNPRGGAPNSSPARSAARAASGRGSGAGSAVLLLRALACAVALLVLLFGVPALLAWGTSALVEGGLLGFGGAGGLWEALSRPDDGRVFLVALALVGWVGWLGFAVSVVREVPAQLRGRATRPVPGLGWSRRAAVVLVGGIVTVLPTAAAATAAPVAAVSTAAPLLGAGAGPQGTAALAEPGQAASGGAAGFAAAETGGVRAWADEGAAGHSASTQLASALPGATALPAGAHQQTSTGPEHVVRDTSPAESLWRIAETRLGDGTRWREIARLNDGRVMDDQGRVFDADQPIQPGWVLLLPADAAPLPEGSGAADGAPGGGRGGAEAPQTVTVRPGDSLSSIAARELGDADAWPELFAANSAEQAGGVLTDPDLLRPGWELTIPGGDGADAGPGGSGGGAEQGAEQGEAGDEGAGADAGQPPAAEAPEAAPGEDAEPEGAGAGDPGEAEGDAPAPAEDGQAAGEQPAPEDGQAPGAAEPDAEQAPPEQAGGEAGDPAPAQVPPQDGGEDRAAAEETAPTAAEEGPEGPDTLAIATTGAGLLLAGFLSTHLYRARVVQQRRRRPGQRIAMPSGDAADYETSLRAQPLSPFDEVDPLWEWDLDPEVDTTPPPPAHPDGRLDPLFDDGDGEGGDGAPAGDDADGRSGWAGAGTDGDGEARHAPGGTAGLDEVAPPLDLDLWAVDDPASTAAGLAAATGVAADGGRHGEHLEYGEYDEHGRKAADEAPVEPAADGWERPAAGDSGDSGDFGGAEEADGGAAGRGHRGQRAGRSSSRPAARTPAGPLPPPHQLVDRALRALASTCAADRRALPALTAVRIDARGQAVLHLETAAEAVPPFHSLGPATQWWCSAADTGAVGEAAEGSGPAGAPDPYAAPSPYPALVHAGDTSTGEPVLLDLESLGLLRVRGPRAQARAVVRSLAAQLAGSTLADHLRIALVGVAPELAGTTLGSDRVRVHDGVEDALRALRDHDAALRRTLDELGLPDARHARGLGIAPDAWVPHVLLCGRPLSAEEHLAVRRLLTDPARTCLAAVTLAPQPEDERLEPDDDPGLPAAWYLDAEGGPTRLPGLDVDLAPRRIGESEYRRLLDLLRTTIAEDVPAPAWTGEANRDEQCFTLPITVDAASSLTPTAFPHLPFAPSGEQWSSGYWSAEPSAPVGRLPRPRTAADEIVPWETEEDATATWGREARPWEARPDGRSASATATGAGTEAGTGAGTTARWPELWDDGEAGPATAEVPGWGADVGGAAYDAAVRHGAPADGEAPEAAPYDWAADDRPDAYDTGGYGYAGDTHAEAGYGGVDHGARAHERLHATDAARYAAPDPDQDHARGGHREETPDAGPARDADGWDGRREWPRLAEPWDGPGQDDEGAVAEAGVEGVAPFLGVTDRVNGTDGTDGTERAWAEEPAAAGEEWGRPAAGPAVGSAAAGTAPVGDPRHDQEAAADGAAEASAEASAVPAEAGESPVAPAPVSPGIGESTGRNDPLDWVPEFFPLSITPLAAPLGTASEPPNRPLRPVCGTGDEAGRGSRGRRSAVLATLTSLAPPSERSRGPRVDVLGPVQVTGTTGSIDPMRMQQLTAMAAYLVLHPQCPPQSLDTVLGGAGPMLNGRPLGGPAAAGGATSRARAAAVGRLREWFGSGEDGLAHLPVGTTALGFADSVGCDWAEFQQLYLEGMRADDETGDQCLAAALSLVRGRPLDGALHGPWGWTEPARQEIISAVVDASSALARRLITRGDHNAAEAAIRRGLLAAPEVETLHRGLFYVLAIAGETDQLVSAVERLHRINSRLGLDMEPETVRLLRELLDQGAA
ncbi:BTAD domain-containing putative transcriptional regulator [Allostreptomyces psammosilenae]|uniref:Nucleoid-associated protein YgaU n=1 Tax=Allostreptomyces psammosilenae TaxID=1892865 RepID=A0A852ZX83_9ACTN|nr:BTAD domain-containing putative transcriptional regulator [Allostreptomyces psammosilenae]NYI03241.1 nucleoid-associated protein YgaU [Allostreptomyces psammosilenae]